MTHKNIDKIAQELAKNYTTKEELIGDQGIFQQLFKKTLQAALDAELTQHLGYEKHAKAGAKNARNGRTKKTLQSSYGKLEISTPRDRESTFEPQIVRKNQRRFDSLDKPIISLYAKGLSTAQLARSTI